MKDMNITIQFFSEWHCGSGLAAGSDVDILAIKDAQGFPFVPGKTIKGLLREAAETLRDLRQAADPTWTAFVQACFGDRTEGADGPEATKSGCLHFGNAVLNAATRQAINDHSTVLFRKRSSTAIDRDGQAKEHTLRRMEVAVPMTLQALVSGLPDAYAVHFQECLAWVKRLGTHRHRGLGRCQFREVQS